MNEIEQAQERVDNVPELQPYEEIIMADWNGDEHWLWVATAEVDEIVDWAVLLVCCTILATA